MNPLLLAAVLALMLLAASGDYEHEQDMIKQACQMHKLWLDGAFANVPVHDRAGWPIDNKQYHEKCK